MCMIVYEGKGEKSVPQDASLKSKVGEVYQRAVWPAKDCGLLLCLLLHSFQRIIAFLSLLFFASFFAKDLPSYFFRCAPSTYEYIRTLSFSVAFFIQFPRYFSFRTC